MEDVFKIHFRWMDPLSHPSAPMPWPLVLPLLLPLLLLCGLLVAQAMCGCRNAEPGHRHPTRLGL